MELASQLSLIPPSKDHPHSLEDLCLNSKVIDTILQSLRNLGKSAGLINAELVGGLALTHDEWTVDNNCLTAAQKLKRAEIVKKYKVQLDSLYLSQ